MSNSKSLYDRQSVGHSVLGAGQQDGPVLSSEREPYRKNNKAIVTKERISIKSVMSQKGEPDINKNWSTDHRQSDMATLFLGK
jgi:hypothetical protein